MSGARPLIGVSTSEVRIAERVDPTPFGEPPQREMALGLKYLRAIEAAGGVPVVMPPLELTAVGSLLDRLSGVCLSGGPDLDPAAYHARAHPKLGPTEPELDRFELEVARQADRRELPILAICRGAQALNVARGGTLHQHLPDVDGVRLQHRQVEACEVATHDIRIAPGSRLAELLGETEVDVNTFHHQAVDRLGNGLIATAWAPDGVIEAIELAGARLVLGVQWHTECLTARPWDSALFAELVAAARQYEIDTSRPAAA